MWLTCFDRDNPELWSSTRFRRERVSGATAQKSNSHAPSTGGSWLANLKEAKRGYPGTPGRGASDLLLGYISMSASSMPNQAHSVSAVIAQFRVLHTELRLVVADRDEQSLNSGPVSGCEFGSDDRHTRPRFRGGNAPGGRRGTRQPQSSCRVQNGQSKPSGPA